MPTAAQHNRQRPTATIETGHIVQSTDQAQADTEAAITLLQTIAPWLARKLVEGGGYLDLRIKLTAPRARRKPTRVYRLQAAVYESDQQATVPLRKEPNTPATA